jgi:hypothetical protein
VISPEVLEILSRLKSALVSDRKLVVISEIDELLEVNCAELKLVLGHFYLGQHKKTVCEVLAPKLSNPEQVTSAFKADSVRLINDARAVKSTRDPLAKEQARQSVLVDFDTRSSLMSFNKQNEDMMSEIKKQNTEMAELFASFIAEEKSSSEAGAAAEGAGAQTEKVHGEKFHGKQKTRHLLADIDHCLSQQPDVAVAKAGIDRLNARRLPGSGDSGVHGGGRAMAAVNEDNLMGQMFASFMGKKVGALPTASSAAPLGAINPLEMNPLDPLGAILAPLARNMSGSDRRVVEEVAAALLSKTPGTDRDHHHSSFTPLFVYSSLRLLLSSFAPLVGSSPVSCVN